MVRLVNAPIELLQGIVHVAQVISCRRQTFEVVTGLGQRIHLARIPGSNAAIIQASDQKMLRLDAHVEQVSRGPNLIQNSLEINARTKRKWLIIDIQVGG